MRQRFSALFARLPEYSRYHRVLRNAEPLLAALALSAVSSCGLHLIDSKPLPIAKGKRADWAKLPEAAKGLSTMGMVFGFKLHALTNEQGLFEKWAFTPANQSDVTLAGELLEGDCKVVLGYMTLESTGTPSFVPTLLKLRFATPTPAKKM